jgi:hypothetical protein
VNAKITGMSKNGKRITAPETMEISQESNREQQPTNSTVIFNLLAIAASVLSNFGIAADFSTSQAQ